MRIKNAILVLMSFVATGFGVTAFSYAHNTPVEEAVKTSIWSDNMIAYLITFGIMVVYSFITGAVSLGLSINSKKSMKIGNALLTKILMIPFFVVNFMYWFPYIFGLGFLSMIGIVILPFALFAVPAILLGVISVVGTYIIMFSTSANLIVPFMKKVFKKEARVGGVIGTLFLFVFCLDAIGTAILGLSIKRHPNPPQQLKYQA